jgi:hypothetical protein
MVNVKGHTPFKISFTCITLTLANGKPMRAIVIAQAPVPGNPQWLYCGLVLENGVTVTKPVRRFDLDAATLRQEVVTMVEAPEEQARHALFAPDGSTIKAVRAGG